MSRWGVFTITDTGALHVAPCNEGGFIIPPHVLSDKCLCKPRLEDGILIHQDDDEDGHHRRVRTDNPEVGK